MNSNKLKGWYLHGKYYGYPNCCIEAFLLGQQSQNSVFSGTGFLPCSKCNKKSPLEIVEIINTNRVCPEEFSLEKVVLVFNSEQWDFEVDLADKIWNASKRITL